jgi:hypothetical protein
LSFPLKDVREPEVELEDRRHEKTAGLAMRCVFAGDHWMVCELENQHF